MKDKYMEVIGHLAELSGYFDCNVSLNDNIITISDIRCHSGLDSIKFNLFNMTYEIIEFKYIFGKITNANCNAIIDKMNDIFGTFTAL